MPFYFCSKRWGHDSGFSTVFRNWHDEGHCRRPHGYSLSFENVFRAKDLDARNWVLGFGELKPMKEWVTWMFDHTMVIADDDPERDLFEDMDNKGLIALRTVPSISCERFAEILYQRVDDWLRSTAYYPRVQLYRTQCWEHPGNSAWIEPTPEELADIPTGEDADYYKQRAEKGPNPNVRY